MLTIANLTANYYVPQGTPDLAALGRRLDRLLQQQLPQAAAGRLQPAPADADAVYRIRQLHVDLWFDNHAMADHELVQRTAALTMRTMTHALLHAGPNDVMRYDDYAHFVAAFIGDLLEGQAWSRWMYEEFAPLRNLPVGQITAQLLAARPALLLPVARRLNQTQQLAPLILQLQLADIRLLLRTGLGFASPPALPPAARRRELLALLAGRLELERKTDSVTEARNTLRAYLAGALAEPTAAADGTLIAVAHHLALLVSLWCARPAPALWQALAQHEVETPAALAPLLNALGADLEQAGAWLRTALDAAAGCRYLAELVAVALPEVMDQPPLPSMRPSAAARPARITSAFAGLALLLPTLRTLHLYSHAGSAGLYQLLVAAAGRALAPLAWGDEGIGWLAGLAAGEMAAARAAPIDWPAVVSRLAAADPGLAAAYDAAHDAAGRISASCARPGRQPAFRPRPARLCRQFARLSGKAIFRPRRGAAPYRRHARSPLAARPAWRRFADGRPRRRTRFHSLACRSHFVYLLAVWVAGAACNVL